MTETERPDAPRALAAEAVLQRRSGPSLVWLIPILAALVGAFVAWRALSERGPEVTITFASAEGLEAGKTPIKYKDVQMGLVEDVRLAPDLSKVIVTARMVRGVDEYLTGRTRFWVVRPRISGGQVYGLGTLLSGSYIGMDPVRDGDRTRAFSGLDVPPVVTTDQPGRHFVLQSWRAGAIDVGTPIYFRKIQVGEVVSSELAPSGEYVQIGIFVHAPHDRRVTAETRFWNASGIDVSVTPTGLQVDTESVVSILIGGVAFDNPWGVEGEPAEDGKSFILFEGREAAQQASYRVKTYYLLHFHQSVRGLSAGSPVEFQGIQIGMVRDVRLDLDRQANGFRIPVVIEVEPERFTTQVSDEAERRRLVDDLVASGLRAQLKSGNLLTGQLVVSLGMFPKAPRAEVVWGQPYPELPTIPTPLEEITASLTELSQRLGKIPVDEIARDLRHSLRSLETALVQTDETLATANTLLQNGSPVLQDLQRTLMEVGDAARSVGLAADQIEEQPESLVFGKAATE